MADVIGEVVIDRAIPSVDAAEALDVAVRGLLGSKTSGISKRKQQTIVMLVQALTGDEDNAVRQLVLNHDFNTRTPEQQAESAAKLDAANAKAIVADMLAEITADKTLLAGSPTAAQVRDAVARDIARQEKIIRGMVYLLRQVS